jgi:hypothetical protein
MLSAILDLVIDAIIASASWVARVVRSLFVHGAVDAAVQGGEEATQSMTSDRKDRRRARKHLQLLADSGEIEELIASYRRMGRSDRFRDLRIDAIVALAAADPAAAAPVLRQIIEGPDDVYVILAALDLAAEHRITGLLDAVAAAKDDTRRLVAAEAGSAHRRLAKVAAPPGHVSA